MNIYVCVKYVPDTAANIMVVGDAAYDDSVKFITNPYDEYAIEEAVQIASETGAEVIAVTVGAEGAKDVLRSALAMGAHRGILVKTNAQFLNSAHTSQALAKAITEDGTPDLVFVGKQSIDSEGMQTPYRLAAALGMPVATDVVGLELKGDKAVLERELGGGFRDVVEVSVPCLVGATRGLNEPRYPKLPDIMKAKRKEVREIEIADLDIDTSSDTMEIIRLEQAPERAQARFIDGGAREAAKELVRLLREEAEVL